MLQPTGALPKPRLGVKPWPHAQERFALALRTLYQLAFDVKFNSLNLSQRFHQALVHNQGYQWSQNVNVSAKSFLKIVKEKASYIFHDLL